MIQDQDTSTSARGEERSNVIPFKKAEVASRPAINRSAHLALPTDDAFRYPVFRRVVESFMPSGAKGCKRLSRYTLQSLRLGFPHPHSVTTKYAAEMEAFLKVRCATCDKRKCAARAEICAPRGVQ